MINEKELECYLPEEPERPIKASVGNKKLIVGRGLSEYMITIHYRPTLIKSNGEKKKLEKLKEDSLDSIADDLGFPNVCGLGKDPFPYGKAKMYKRQGRK